ncbi:hypothetical protein BDV10DRAFT_197924 [Aspergillus recurvatus]
MYRHFDHSTSDLVYSKVAEGAFDRFASEVANLDCLRLHGIHTSKVYGRSSSKLKRGGAEDIFMEKLASIPLGEMWYTIAEWETRLVSLRFPASGSPYYHKDILERDIRAVGERELTWTKLMRNSESLRQSQTTPPESDSLSAYEQTSMREIMRRRIIHFLYAALTKRLNTPREGDSITLQADMMRTVQNWPRLITADSLAGEGNCTSPPLWLGANDEYESAKETAHEIEAKMLEAADTPSALTGIKDHLQFDDCDENS